MKKLLPQEVDIPTWHFKVHKFICISHYRVMFMVNYSQRHCVDPFHCCTPQGHISNGLLSDPNVGCMETLYPKRVAVPTYHFRVQKIVSVSSFRMIFRVHHI